jgi:hypothetical protein
MNEVVGSELVEDFAFQMKATKLDRGFFREYHFHDKRNWRFDFADPERMVAVEVEGGAWSGGRHTRGSGFIKDCEKYNEAAILGWFVLRVTRPSVDDGSAIGQLERLLNNR